MMGSRTPFIFGAFFALSMCITFNEAKIDSDPIKHYDEKFGADMIKYTISMKKDAQLAISVANDKWKDENGEIKEYNISENQSQVEQIVDGNTIVFVINTDAEEYESSDWQFFVPLLKRMTKLRHVIFDGPNVKGALIKKLIELLPGEVITFLGFVNCTEMQKIDNIRESLPNVKYLLIGNSSPSIVASVSYHFDDEKRNGLVYLGIIGTETLTFSDYEHLLMNNSLKEGFDYLTSEMEQFDQLHNLLTHAKHSLSVVHFQYTANGNEIEYDRSNKTYDAVHQRKFLLTLRTTDIAKVNELIAAESMNPRISFKAAGTLDFTGLKDMSDFDEFKKAFETLNPYNIKVVGVGANSTLAINALWNAIWSVTDEFNASKQLLSIELSSSADKTTADYLYWSKGVMRTIWTIENRSLLDYTIPTDGNEVTFKTGNITNEESQKRTIAGLTKNNPKYLYIAQENGTLIKEIETEIRNHKQMVDKIPFPGQDGLTPLQKASIMIWSSLIQLNLECNNKMKKEDVEFWFEFLISLKYLIVWVDEEPEEHELQDMGGEISLCASIGTDKHKTNKIIIKCEKKTQNDRNASKSDENWVSKQFKNFGFSWTTKSSTSKATANDIELEDIGTAANK